MDAVEVEPVVDFWLEALGYRRLYERDPFVVLGPPPGDPRPRVLIQRVGELAAATSRVHMDVRVDDPDAEVERLTGLGASVRSRIDETGAGGSRWTTMTDPQGTVFCVCPAREG